MIRCATQTSSVPAWHATFLEMLPAIRRQARIAFRHLDPEGRDEAVQEVVAHAVVAIKALYDRGTPELAYPSVLAMHGIKRVKIGRKAATKMNVRDISSEYCRLSKGVQLERLDKFDAGEGCWCEVLVEDKHAGPAETAAARIDVGDWMETLPSRDQKIAEALGVGERTGDVARRFGLSLGRISQKRREFLESWQGFQGENGSAQGASPVAV